MNTPFAKLRHLRIAGLAVGAVAVAGAAVLVTASAAGLSAGPRASSPQAASISDKATPASICDAFLTHLTADLNKGLTKTQVNAAIQKAIGETLADEVKNGDLKQAQADGIKQKLSTQPTCALGGLGRNADRSDHLKAGVYKQLLLSAAASALGVSDTQLKADLASGKTVSQLVPANTTEDQFRAKLIAKLTPMLDTAITNKQLTAAQKTEILKRLQTGPVPYWNKPAHKTVAPAAPAA
ncbi:MAG: hypothetical protein NVS1B3_00110 [Candidatus Dormibacteraceae bacterium]